MREKKGWSLWLVAVGAGIIGAALTAAAFVVAAPHYLAPKLVRDGMLADPEILVAASEALQSKQHEPVLTAYRQALETPFASSWKGAEKPDVVLVEFFDYGCGYCRASNPHVDRLLAEDKGLRVVYREFPILGEGSLTAARMSMAASRAGRFRPFYDALFAAGPPTPETLELAARAAGMPSQAPSDPTAEAELRRNYQMAQQLGVQSTPLFIVGNKVINGAVGYDALKQAIAEVRAN